MSRTARRALALGALLAVTAAGCGGVTGRGTGAPGPGTTASPSTTPVPQPSGSETPPADPSPTPGTMLVPVYYLGTTHVGPRLYREFRSVPRSTGVVRAAVDAMLHLEPLDPDYRSLWPRSTRLLGVSITGDVARVDVSGEARSASAGAEAEAVSLQQLVYTVTAAAPAVRRVQLLVDGRVVETLWGHEDTRAPMARKPQVDVLAPVWIIQPAYDAAVSRTFAMSGDATVFEGTVSWDVRACPAAGGCSVVVRDGFTTTDGAPARGEWSVTVTIPDSYPAGTRFELRAWEDSAEDGRPLFRDTKVVRLGR